MRIDLDRLQHELQRVGGEVVALSEDRGQLTLLVHLSADDATPWVTWRARADVSSGFFWGHYHHDEDKARSDFVERIGGLS
jgi:hypothetical protein